MDFSGTKQISDFCLEVWVEKTISVVTGTKETTTPNRLKTGLQNRNVLPGKIRKDRKAGPWLSEGGQDPCRDPKQKHFVCRVVKTPGRSSGEAAALRGTRAHTDTWTHTHAQAPVLPDNLFLPPRIPPGQDPGKAAHRLGCILGGGAQGSRDEGRRDPVCTEGDVPLWVTLVPPAGLGHPQVKTKVSLLQPAGQAPRALGPRGLGRLRVTPFPETQEPSGLLRPPLDVHMPVFPAVKKPPQQRQFKPLCSSSDFYLDSKNRCFQTTSRDSINHTVIYKLHTIIMALNKIGKPSFNRAPPQDFLFFFF